MNRAREAPSAPLPAVEMHAGAGPTRHGAPGGPPMPIESVRSRRVFLSGLALVASTGRAVFAGAGDAPSPPAPRRDDPGTWVWSYPAGSGHPLLQHLALRSRSNGREIGFNVYLPPGYPDGRGRLPVLYFLHGATGNENADAPAVTDILHAAITSGALPPVVGVFPNGGPFSGYADRVDGAYRVETFLVRELVPHIDRQYRTRAGREGRAVAGFSMGGDGSIRLVFKYPEVFGAAASWGAPLRARRDGEALVGGAAAYDPYLLSAAVAERMRDRTRLLLITGERDSLPAHEAFARHLRALRVPLSYRVLAGVGHQLDRYYAQSGPDVIAFLGTHFRSVR
jgi:enterochelin esterase-like enzyme